MERLFMVRRNQLTTAVDVPLLKMEEMGVDNGPILLEFASLLPFSAVKFHSNYALLYGE
jgi:hypothetical protein